LVTNQNSGIQSHLVAIDNQQARLKGLVLHRCGSLSEATPPEKEVEEAASAGIHEQKRMLQF
jgi:hypothetical protein